MSYDVRFSRMDLSAVFDLKGEATALHHWIEQLAPDFPDQPNTAHRTGELEVYWIGDDHWLLRAPVAREADLIDALRSSAAPVELSIVHVSDTLAFFDISGPDADDILAIASPLDISPVAFPENGVSYTDIFGLKGLVVRRPDGFEIAVERSFADMIEDYLCRVSGTQPM